MPRVSVIVPARDAAATLPATLAGLASQRVDGGAEVVVVDDGSRDGTGALARASSVVDRVVEGRGDGRHGVVYPVVKELLPAAVTASRVAGTARSARRGCRP